jgi:hypothetical protein
MGYVMENLQVNGKFYLGDGRFPILFSLLAMAGLVGRPKQEERLYFAMYFLMFFGIFLMFYAGSYDYGADVRYSLMTYPALAVLGGLGASTIVESLERHVGGRRAVAAVTTALVVQFFWYAGGRSVCEGPRT